MTKEHKYYKIDGNKTWEFFLYNEDDANIDYISEYHSREKIQEVIDMLTKAINEEEPNDITIPETDNMLSALEACTVKKGWTAKNIFWLFTAVICWFEGWFIRLYIELEKKGN